MTDAHSAIAHRGRDKTDHYVRERYAGINQEVTELFVSLCTLHQSQRSVTSYMKKPVIKPIAADGGKISAQPHTSLCMQNKLIMHALYCFLRQWPFEYIH